MSSYPNISKAAHGPTPYVGAGGARLYMIHKGTDGLWQARAAVPGTRRPAAGFPILKAKTLADISAQLAALPIESGKLLPAVNAMEG